MISKYRRTILIYYHYIEVYFIKALVWCLQEICQSSLQSVAQDVEIYVEISSAESNYRLYQPYKSMYPIKYIYFDHLVAIL